MWVNVEFNIIVYNIAELLYEMFFKSIRIKVSTCNKQFEYWSKLYCLELDPSEYMASTS